MLIHVYILNLFKEFLPTESNENNADINDNDEDANSTFHSIHIHFLLEIDNSY